MCKPAAFIIQAIPIACVAIEPWTARERRHDPSRTDEGSMNIRSAQQRRDGIALIIVLVVIVVLAILAGGFAYSMKVETTLARHASFSSELDWMGRSGVEVARWVLAQESQGPQGQVDSLRCKWAGGPGD